MSSTDVTNPNNTKPDQQPSVEQPATSEAPVDKPPLHPKAAKHIQELLAEKLLLDHIKFPHAVKLIEQEIEKIENAGRAPPKESKYIDLNKNKPIRVTGRVLIPVKQYPKFNFIGKILGPKGHTLRRLQEETLCRILIQGRGSMRDPNKEKELLASSDPKYNHLADELNVEISAVGAPAEAHARMAYALAELKKHLTPDNMDYISIEQLEELERMRENSNYNYRDPQSSTTPFKKPAAAAFDEERFYDTLNRAQSSMDDGYGYSQNTYNYSYKSMPYSTENYDDPKYAQRYTDYSSDYTRRPNNRGYGGGSGNEDTSNRDYRYKAGPYDRPQEQKIPTNQQ